MDGLGLRSFAVVAAVSLIAGFGGAAIYSWSGLGHSQTRDYLLENPEILPQMAENFQRGEASKRLADISDEVIIPFEGAVLGNPQGSVTLVEFTDYGCGFCRMSREHVEALIAANPDLRVVIREWPIFDGSEQAARMALAAADQGRFAEFHRAMFESGTPTDAAIAQAARQAGIDQGAAETFMASQLVDAEMARNMAFARQLGFSGTPSWVVGDAVLEGAVGVDALQEAIDAARQS